MNISITNNYKTKINVFGYYVDSVEIHFTCINQDESTPQSFFQLDFSMEIEGGWNLIDEGQKGRVYIPINNPKG